MQHGMPSSHVGTTSACAENTPISMLSRQIGRNYLRVRGEYLCHVDIPYSIMELPPRARRIREWVKTYSGLPGTTSACAENTAGQTGFFPRRGNYLRVRGEYIFLSILWFRSGELPPRARRIHIHHMVAKLLLGTTSACAENTAHMRGNYRPRRNYLRVRGEYTP